MMSPKVKTILLWIGRVAMAALFLMAGSQKLMGAPMMLESFAKYGLGDWFRYFTGSVEVVGAILLLIPRTSFYAALLLLCVLIGAFIAQTMVLHGDVIHVLVFALVVGALAWFQRPASFSTRTTGL